MKGVFISDIVYQCAQVFMYITCIEIRLLFTRLEISRHHRVKPAYIHCTISQTLHSSLLIYLPNNRK